MRTIRAAVVAGFCAATGPIPVMAADVDGSPTASADAAAGDVYPTVAVDPDSAADAGPSAGEASEPPHPNRLIEEIVVTAQKREERLQDVPISIQAFGGDALEARGIQRTDQLGASVPALQFSNVAGFTLIFMRGIGTDNFIPSADPSIATYIDGIYVPQGPGAATSLATIQRVEVLKGPQGTLFGRNATGGAISITTLDPDGPLSASADVEAGNHDARSIKASLAGSVTDWLSIGVSALASDRDSTYTNINYEGQDDRMRSGRLRASLHPLEDLSLSVTAFHSEQEGMGSVIGKNIRPTTVGRLLGIQPQPDDYTAVSDFPAQSRAIQDMVYGNLDWSLPAFDVRLLGGDVEVVSRMSQTDFDGSPLPIAGFNTTNNYTNLRTAELQVLSNDTTWGSERFTWVAGLYHLKSEAGFDPAHFFAAPGAVRSLSDYAESQTGAGVPEALLTRLDSLPIAGRDGVKLTFTGILGTRSDSAYAQGTFHATDWLDLTVGGRVQREKRYLIESTTVGVPWGLDSVTDDNFSPRAVLGVHLRDNALVYASWSVGYKSGTYNIVNLYTPPNYIVPEKVTSYELGAKLDFLDGQLRVNGAVFHNDIDHLQSGFVSLLSGGAVKFLTVPHARSRGAELDGTWIPMPGLDPGLALSGNVAYVDARYTDFGNGEGFDETTGLYQQGQDFDGHRMVRTPKVSGGLSAVQMLESASGETELALDAYYNAGFFYDPANTVEEDAYFTLGARAGHLHRPWNLRVTAFCVNLLDERYHVQQFQTDFGVISTLASPREYGLRLSWSF